MHVVNETLALSFEISNELEMSYSYVIHMLSLAMPIKLMVVHSLLFFKVLLI